MALHTHRHQHSRTPGLPVEESRAGLHGVGTPEENDSLAESHSLSQNEYGEPRDHSVRTPCPLLSNLQLSRQLIEEHPHGSVLFFISSFFIRSFFIRSFFIISFFIRSFFIHYFFYTFIFYMFNFYTVHFLYGSFFIIQNFRLQPSIKK